jgi:hypothetical protein
MDDILLHSARLRFMVQARATRMASPAWKARNRRLQNPFGVAIFSRKGLQAAVIRRL